MPTLDELSDYVQEHASLTDTEATAKLKGAGGWVNEAYKKACRDTGANVDELTEEALTGGTASYALSSLFDTDWANVQKLRSLYVSSGAATRQPLKYREERDMDELRAYVGSETGDPEFYTVLGYNRIIVHPTPGSGVTIGGTYHKRPTALSADGDIPSAIPEELHFPLIGNWAMFKALEYEGRLDEAERARQAYLAAVGDAVKDKRRFGGRTPGPLRPSKSHSLRGLLTWQQRAGIG